MSRPDRLLTDKEEMIGIIDRCQVIHIGMHDGDEIYVLPMNFGYTWEDGELTFYMHGAVKGKKTDLLKKNPRVGFQLDCDHRLVEGKLPCQYSFKFASVTGTGEAQILEEPQEKIEAMKILMKKYSDKEYEFTERLLTIVSVIKLKVKEFSGRKAT